MGEIGIVIEAIGALYLVIIARRAKKDAVVRGLIGSQVTYDQLGPLLDSILRQLHTNYRNQGCAFALLFFGLGLQLVASIATKSTIFDASLSWQGFATNKRTGKIERWEIYRATRADCLKDMEYDLRESVHEQWYRAPFGCMFMGSDNKYELYVVNRFFNSSAFGCVARLKKPEKGREYEVTWVTWERETDWYRCELPK